MAKHNASAAKNPAVTPNGPAARPATAAPTQPAHSSLQEPKPNLDQIRKRAFEIYQDRITRGLQGDAAADWLRAERECARR